MEEGNQFEQLNKIISEFEKTLSWKRAGDLSDRVNHVLHQYRQIADNAINKTKSFTEDVRIQFKALEIITEGLTGDLNHGQKRTIANHIIRMLRDMVDRLSQMEYDYSATTFERYNFFRSATPEGRLYEDRNNLKHRVEYQDKLINDLKEKHPDIFKDVVDEIPF
jgi:flagellin-specific chaperone FliS